MLTRRATTGDLDALVALWREMWDFNADLDPRMAAGPLANIVQRSWLSGHIEGERSLVLVAQEGRDLAGYALATILENPPIVAHQFYGYVSEMAVRASKRRSGVGTLLLDGLHAWFRTKGLPYAEVTAGVRNQVSRNFWRRQGYSEFVERLRLDFQ
ncbi:MAG TPA: GNAT family N-acetyltransferase [Planctomycetota bacterium]|nr:GNAT family N-acetyltransferase [Planctomycetota bacterium]